MARESNTRKLVRGLLKIEALKTELAAERQKARGFWQKGFKSHDEAEWPECGRIIHIFRRQAYRVLYTQVEDRDAVSVDDYASLDKMDILE